MLETANNRIDIQALDRQVMWEAQKYSYLWEGAGSLSPVGSEVPEPIDGNIADSIAAAAAVANVESPHYTLDRYKAPLRWLARGAARGVLYLSSIVTHAQTHFNYHVVSGLDLVNRRFERIDATNRLHAGIIGWLGDVLPRVGDQVLAIEKQMVAVTARLGQMDSRLSQADKERVDHGQELELIRERLPRLEQQMNAMAEQLAQQAARLSLLERVARQPQVKDGAGAGAGDGATPVINANASSALDGLYMVFEDHFRGSREQIRERLGEYLPLVDNYLAAGHEEVAAVDLGCGRGEWLQLLQSRGVKALGIDSNTGFLGQCEEAGLDVVESDALEYIISLPDESVAIITGFHIIEHLEFAVLVRLVDEVQRVLCKGGVAIFETPNPKNLIVGACNFYADPTHVRQIFPDLLEFVMQSRGFQSVSLRYLNPHPQEQQLATEEAPILAGQLNGLLSCARDFAVIAYK